MGLDITGFDELTNGMDELIAISEIIGSKPHTLNELEEMYHNTKSECTKEFMKSLIETAKEQTE